MDGGFLGTRRRPQEFEISVYPPWASLGALFRLSWAVSCLGRLLLGPSWCPLDWAVLGPSWGLLGPSCLERSWGSLRSSCLGTVKEGQKERKANKHAEHYLFIAFSLYAFDDLCLLRPSISAVLWEHSWAVLDWTPLSWAGLKPSWTVARLSWPVSTLSWTVSALRSGPLKPSWLELFGGSGEPPGCVGELVRPPP